MHDLYEELEVSKTASLEAIRGAYKHLVQKWHPDRHSEDRDFAEQKTRALNEAYGVLSDPELREEYDNRLRAQRDQFEPPGTVEEAQFEHEGGEELLYAAPMDVMSASRFHRLFLWTFLAYIASLILFNDSFERFGYVFFPIFGFAVFGMARALKKNGWLWGAFGLVPVLGWILGAILINQCNTLFKQHGLKARFFGGAKPLTENEAVNQRSGPLQSGWAIFKWTWAVLGVVALISIGLAIALPAYQNYRQRNLVADEGRSSSPEPKAADPVRSADHPIGGTEAQQNQQFNDMLDQLEAVYAPANPNSPNYSSKFITDLEDRIRAYESQGANGVDALQRATMDLAGVRLYIPAVR